LRPKQRVPGIDVAGTVAALGPGVDRFALGDAVFGELAGGFQWQHAGAWAELVAADAAALEAKPAGLSFEDAAAAPTSAAIALQAVRDEGRVAAGQRVLINGAGGAVGTYAVQLAKHLGAHVSAVDRGEKLVLLRALGADRVIDFESERFSEAGERWDVIIDIASTLTVPQWRSIITPSGRYSIIGHDDYGRRGRRLLGSIPHMLGLLLRKRWIGHLPDWEAVSSARERFATVAELLGRGAIRSVVGRTFPLRDAAEALRTLARGEAHGQLVLALPAPEERDRPGSVPVGAGADA
jgi:NADPH:quinone reductase-like Zn-dependent oxidoreductase